jgi:fermentation-respiration switch protein FrsA (DUF1100 family)
MSARALSLAALLMLAAVFATVMWIDNLIFFPERAMPRRPAAVEDRWITTPDGVRLHAWYAHASETSPTLIWSHGNGGNIGGRAAVLLALQAHDLNVLAYDYRGYGHSDGAPTETGVYVDAVAAYDSERSRGVPAERIVCFGESLGGAVSIYLAGQRACAGVAVVSTFTSVRDVARSHFGPLAALAGGRFDSLERIGTLSVPLFVAHGEEDEIVSFALGEQLYAAAPEPKRFVRIAGAHHNDIFGSPTLIGAIATFAREVIGLKTTAKTPRAPRSERDS